MKKPTLEYLENIPTIDLGDILLRQIKASDYLDLYEYGKKDKVTKTLFWDSYQKEEDALNSIKYVFLSRPSKGIPSAHAIIDKKRKKMIGTCDIFRVDWDTLTGEIGYVLHDDYWGKGIMTKVCKAVIDYGFEYVGLNKIEIAHEINNIGSKRVIEKCGFNFVTTKLHKERKQYISYYELYRFEN
jgi:ribosomal-protein-alanine N-acetyltransferase